MALDLANLPQTTFSQRVKSLDKHIETHHLFIDLSTALAGAAYFTPCLNLQNYTVMSNDVGRNHQLRQNREGPFESFNTKWQQVLLWHL